MTKHTILAPLLALALVSCGDDLGSDEPAKEDPVAESGSTAIGAAGVELVSHSIEAGNPPTDAIETGLQAAAETLSGLYADALKEYPDLTGNIRGTFHIEPDGTVRMFAAKDSEFSTEEGKSISSAFIGATFGGKYSFPDLGENVLLKIDFQLNHKG